jgi:hypothetical protein
MNLEAERMIDRIIWCVVFPGIVLIIVAAAGTAYFMLR